MKKIITLFIIILSIISLYSCNYVEEDYSVIYNGIKYYQLPGACGGYLFSDKSHKVGTYLGFMGYRYELYCLDSDIEENILFAYGSPNTIWVKEGYQFNRETKIDSIKISNGVKSENIRIENCSFNSLFIETDIINYDESKEYLDLHITLKYGEDIQWFNFLELLDGQNLYLIVYNNNEKCAFRVADEYQEEFKSYIIGLNSDNKIEE